MTNEQVTLHTDSWNSIVRTLRSDGNPTTNTIANTIDAQRGDPPFTAAVGFCGLPGAGKSVAAKMLAEKIDGTKISMGDAIRREYAKSVYDAYPEDMDGNGFAATSSALGEFAANAREEDAAQIPDWVTDIADNSDDWLFAIDGVRSPTDYDVLNDYFDYFVVVRIDVPFYDRLERLRDRDREGEGEFDAEDLAVRDTNEFENLGYRALLEYKDDWADEFLPDLDGVEYDTGVIDATIRNTGTVDELSHNLDILMEGYEWLPNPKT